MTKFPKVQLLYFLQDGKEKDSMWFNLFCFNRKETKQLILSVRVETKHRIARNLARITRKFTRLTKIEIEMLKKIIARFLLGSKEDRKFYARDRSDRNSMLEMIARELKLKLDKEN